jgi:radical SAM protein with 4Fe4S-binding SPASM domain
MDEETKDRYSKSPNIVGGCMAGIGVAYLNVDGSVFPCSKLPFSLGNIHTEKFSDIWNDSPFLHQLRNRKNLLGKCGKCKYVNMCGGCRASGFEQRGKLFDEDYMCWL